MHVRRAAFLGLSLPWTQVMRAMIAPTAGRAAALAPVLPELGSVSPAAGEAAGFELAAAVMAALGTAAARRPLLVVLDDLHAADAGSLRWAGLGRRPMR
jgi:hypothetical protein